METQRQRLSEAGVLLTLFCLAFVAAVSVTAITKQFSIPERWEYSKIADSLLRGEGGSYEYFGTKYYFYGPATYPVLLAAVLWVTKSETVMLILQALLFGSTCLVIYEIAHLFFGKREARLAALFATLHPGGLVYTGKLHSLTLDIFLVALSFLLLAKAMTETPTPLKAAAIGLVAGLTALSRGTTLPFFVLWTVWLTWKERGHLSRILGVIFAFVIGSAIVIAPLLLRGYLLYGEIVPLRTDKGVNLWYGNHPGASGTSYTLSPSPVPVVSQIPQELSARLIGANEIAQNRIFTATALTFIRTHPQEAFLLFLKKFFWFWWFSPHTGLLYPPHWRMVYTLYYSFVLFFAGIGLFVSVRAGQGVARRGAFLFLLIAGIVSVTQALFYVEGRHRWTIELILLVFAASGILGSVKRR